MSEEEHKPFRLIVSRTKRNRKKLLKTTRNKQGRSASVRSRYGRCFANLQSTRNTKTNRKKLAAHIRYLVRESAACLTSSKPVVFGTSKLEEFRSFLPGEKRIHKLVLSPEEYFSMDSQTFVFAFMSRLLKDAGCQGQGVDAGWVAVQHLNTAQPHFHVLIRGIDTHGHDVVFPRSIYPRLAGIASAIQMTLTGELTHTEEVLRERTEALKFSPMTKAGNPDCETLIRAASTEFSYSGLMASMPVYRRKALHGRLSFLKRHGLINFHDEGMVTKTQDFHSKWKALVDLLNSLSELIAPKYCSTTTLNLATEASGKVMGICTQVVKHGGINYALVETIKDSALAVQVIGLDLSYLEELIARKTLLEIDGAHLRAYRGDPFTKLEKLRSRGRVVSAICGYSVDNATEVNQELRKRLRNIDEKQTGMEW